MTERKRRYFVTARNGGPAFPSPGYSPGMSLEDWMATQIFTALLVNDRGATMSQNAQAAYEGAHALLMEKRHRERVERVDWHFVKQEAIDAHS